MSKGEKKVVDHIDQLFRDDPYLTDHSVEIRRRYLKMTIKLFLISHKIL